MRLMNTTLCYSMLLTQARGLYGFYSWNKICFYLSSQLEIYWHFTAVLKHTQAVVLCLPASQKYWLIKDDFYEYTEVTR